MQIKTTRFGTLEIEEEKIITMVRGILGFPDFKKYVVVPHKEDSPFFWLQSVENPDLAFVVISPGRFFSDYVFDISDAVASELEIQDVSAVEVMVIVTFNPDKEVTANLLGPVVVNTSNGRGCQVVLDPNVYPVRYPLSQEARKQQAKGRGKVALQAE